MFSFGKAVKITHYFAFDQSFLLLCSNGWEMRGVFDAGSIAFNTDMEEEDRAIDFSFLVLHIQPFAPFYANEPSLQLLSFLPYPNLKACRV